MKATGIVRKIDELGRVVIPMELRRTLGIQEGDPLEIFVDVPPPIIERRTMRLTLHPRWWRRAMAELLESLEQVVEAAINLPEGSMEE